MTRLNQQKGFTLLELILYVGIAAVILLTTSMMLSTLYEVRVKNQTIAEVTEQGLQAMQIITQTARNAEAITSPAVGTSGSSLTLDVATSASDPTTFDLSSGVLRATEGTGAAVSLTNTRVTASSLTFQNLSQSSTPGTIQIQFTLTSVNTGGTNPYAYSQTFTGSATLRQP